MSSSANLVGEVSLLVLAGGVGATTGAAVSVLKQCIAFTESLSYNDYLKFLFSSLGDAANTPLVSTLVYASVPALGGVFVGAARSWVPWFDDRRNEAAALIRALAAVVTLGTGNSLGPEGPCVDLGTAVADSFGRLLGREDDEMILSDSSTQISVLTAAGAAAAVAAGFSAPVAGVFYALEVTLPEQFPSSQNRPVPRTAIAAVALSAAVAALVARDVIPVRLEIVQTASSSSGGLAELPWFLGLGALCGLEAVAVRQAISAADVAWEGVPKAVRPGLAGAASVARRHVTLTLVISQSRDFHTVQQTLICALHRCGLVGVAVPQVLFNGYATLNTILADANPPDPATLLLYAAVKIVTTASSRAAGLVGGLFAPALFLGATAGGAYGQLVQNGLFLQHGFFLVHETVQTTGDYAPAYASVGAASVLAGLVRAPLAASMLLFELTRDYDVVLPLIASTGVAAVVIEVLSSSSSSSSSDGASASSVVVDDDDDDETLRCSSPGPASSETEVRAAAAEVVITADDDDTRHSTSGSRSSRR